MIEFSSLLPFLIASAILVLIPGPAILYIVSTGIGRGRKMALASMLGIEVGALFHVAAAALGLSAIVASSAIAYSIVKYAGAIYLIHLGVKRSATAALIIRSKSSGTPRPDPPLRAG